MRLPALFALSLLCSTAAYAQKVVVLELDGDPQNKLRTQIENAVKLAGVVELVPLKAYKDAATKKKLKGAAAMTPVGVARVSRLIPLDAAVGGEVTDATYNVVIYDRAGQELWTKSLAVKRGLLSEDFATKLARAIAAAAEQGAARATAPAEDPQPEADPVATTEPTQEEPPPPTPEPEMRDEDLYGGAKKKEAPRVPVPFVRLWLAGTTTWRSQCLRPGVTSCKEYDLAQVQPTGISIDFTATVPYLGLSLNADVFPLAFLNNRILQGFGLLVGFQYGQSQTRIVEETPQGQGPDKIVKSDDIGFSLKLAWRYHFQMGYGDPQPVGYVGLHGGLQARSFLIDASAGTSLPSSERVFPTGLGYPAFGLDASIPIAKYFRVEAALSYFVNPRTAPEQIVGYGNLNDPTGGAVATGWAIEGGVAGDLWGPLGYVLRVRHFSFTDRYYGQGQKWTVCNDLQCGGAGEESFTSIIWGATATF
jgi:hypothetical protein